MSGHSKWSKIKHQKQGNDLKRGLIFTKLGSAITIAIRAGNKITDPESNFRLRLAIEKAKSANMPKDNIDRAIKRGIRKGETNNLDEVIYEGYGPGGIAILIVAVTDNRVRTASEIKNLFDKAKGKLAVPGSVSFLFKQLGQITIPIIGKAQDLMITAIDCGAIDVDQLDNYVLVYTEKSALMDVKNRLSKNDISIQSAEEIYKPLSPITLDNQEEINKITSLVDKFEEHGDIIKVYSNIKVLKNI